MPNARRGFSLSSPRIRFIIFHPLSYTAGPMFGLWVSPCSHSVHRLDIAMLRPDEMDKD